MKRVRVNSRLLVPGKSSGLSTLSRFGTFAASIVAPVLVVGGSSSSDSFVERGLGDTPCEFESLRGATDPVKSLSLPGVEKKPGDTTLPKVSDIFGGFLNPPVESTPAPPPQEEQQQQQQQEKAIEQQPQSEPSPASEEKPDSMPRPTPSRPTSSNMGDFELQENPLPAARVRPAQQINVNVPSVEQLREMMYVLCLYLPVN